MTTDKISCKDCGELILPLTAEKTGCICMACKQGTRQSIETSKEFYRKQKEYDPYSELWKYLHNKVYRMTSGFSGLTKPEKLYFAVNLFDGEVYNGGIEQFFWNSSGEVYSEVIEGLITLKAENSLFLLRQAIKILFGEVEPPKDRELRWQLMKQYPEDENAPKPDWSIELEKIDDAYYENLDKLDELLTDYAKITGLIQLEVTQLERASKADSPNKL